MAQSFDVDAQEQTLLRAQAMVTMTRLAAQQSTDELPRETLYEVMLAVEDYLDEALNQLAPLKLEAEQQLHAGLESLRRKA